MARELIVSSTTDDQKDVNAAAGVIASIEGEATQVVESQEPEPQPSPEPEPQKPPQKTKAEKRIDKLVFEREEEKRKREELERRIADMEAKSVGAPTPTPQVPQPEGLRAKPTREGTNPQTGKPYETIEEYFEDLADWKVERKLAEREAAEEQAAMVAATQEVEASYHEQSASARERYADFDDAISNIAEMEILQPLIDYIKEQGNGADIAYYLGKHPDEVRKLHDMDLGYGFAYLGRIGASLEGPPEERPAAPTRRSADERPVSSAPAPIKPLTGHSTKSSVSLDELPFSEYRKIRDKQEKEKYRRS